MVIKMDRRKIGILTAAIVTLLFVVLFGPLDCFSHGYYCDEIPYDEAVVDVKDYIVLEDGDFEMQFSPAKDHFAGFELNLINQPEDNTGILLLTLLDEKGKTVDEIEVDLSKVSAAVWYKVYTNVSLKKGKIYTLRFSAVSCATTPYLQIIDSDYLGAENITGDVLLGYAYANPTFTFQNKVLITLFIIGVWGFLCGKLMRADKYKRTVYYAAGFVMATAILSWNYMYNSMDSQNDKFEDFQIDSESLVTSMVMAQHYGVDFKEADKGWGLGGYCSKVGYCNGFDIGGVTDENWNKGYSRTEEAVSIDSNAYTQSAAAAGNYILFSNGDMFQITDVSDYGSVIILHLNAGRTLNPLKYGDLADAQFLDANQAGISNGELAAYKSQYGLQGKLFKYMARYMDYEEAISNLRLICAMATAVVFVIIVYLLSVKYNPLMAGIFFVTFWLSPWVVNFANNLYWVEFTWFVPMAIGVFCAWQINNKKCRIFSYIAAFMAIAVKCLCGYEYISTIMMGLIAFLLADFLVAVISRDKANGKLILRTVILLGLAALAGFAAAICIHAVLKGNGSMLEGVKNIYEQDVLRRTVGADYNGFSMKDMASFSASVWEVCCGYFHFTTEVIVGINGNLFPILCLMPICIFLYEDRKKNLNYELMIMYVVFFLTSLSWFCLAKAHSQQHGHMNYVLWYFGYVQICFYIIINKVVSLYKNPISPKGE